MKESLIILKHHIENKNSDVLKYCSHLEHREYVESSAKMPFGRYFAPHIPDPTYLEELPIELENGEGFRKLVKNGCLYTSGWKKDRRSDNSVALTEDGEFIKIIDFIIDQDQNVEFVMYHELVVADAVENSCSFIKLVIRENQNLKYLPTSKLSKVCVNINLEKM